jgi:hypothetical protein
VAKSSSGGEFEYHVVASRLRIVGSGNYKSSLIDLDDINTVNFIDIAMSTTTRIEPTRLSNFQSQRIRYIGQVTEINEWFKISRIILFAKAVAVEYPM